MLLSFHIFEEGHAYIGVLDLSELFWWQDEHLILIFFFAWSAAMIMVQDNVARFNY
jgi:hypothetical protein